MLTEHSPGWDARDRMVVRETAFGAPVTNGMAVADPMTSGTSVDRLVTNGTLVDCMVTNGTQWTVW